jgi:hypothetical protein
MNVI